MHDRIPHTPPARVRVNERIELVYDRFGDPAAPVILLVSGLGQQMIGWDEPFCRALAARGFRVVRFDNRDVGLSTHLDELGVPNVLEMMQRKARGEPVEAPYTLQDMADDAIGLMDALEIPAAHVVGASMGGFIAQEMAIRYPDRLLTLTSIMSSTGAPDLPQPKPEAAALLVTPFPTDREGYIEHTVRTWRVLSGPGFPFDEAYVREKAARAFDRGLSLGGTVRQLAAILASESRRERLRSVRVPTLVIHGDADPLVPVEGGIDTARAIPGARLMIVEGMGHDIPPALAPRIVDAIARHAEAVVSPQRHGGYGERGR